MEGRGVSDAKRGARLKDMSSWVARTARGKSASSWRGVRVSRGKQASVQ